MGDSRDSDHSIGHPSVVAESVIQPRHDVEPLAENKQEEVSKLQLEEYLLKQLLYQLETDRKGISFAINLQKELSEKMKGPEDSDLVDRAIQDLRVMTIFVAEPEHFAANTEKAKSEIKLTKLPFVEVEPNSGRYIKIICKYVDNNNVDNYIYLKVTTDMDFISFKHEEIQKKILKLQNTKPSDLAPKKN